MLEDLKQFDLSRGKLGGDFNRHALFAATHNERSSSFNVPVPDPVNRNMRTSADPFVWFGELGFIDCHDPRMH